MDRIRLPKCLACAALAAGLLLTSADAFSDAEGHWAQWAIQKWSQEYNIIQGYEDNTFRPDNSITRGAFAGILDRFFHFQAASPPETFSDIQGHYWEEAILKLNAAGVYLGNEGKALAEATITRQQAVTMLARAFNIAAETPDLPYTDAAAIAEYARPSVAELTARGYVNDAVGVDFRPADPITRAEVVNILANMIQVLLQSPGPYSQDVDGSLMISAAEGAALSEMAIAGDLILAPGVQGAVTLYDVEIAGSVRNFSAVEPELLYRPPGADDPPAEDPEGNGEEGAAQPPPQAVPGIQPGEVYTPGAITGETLIFDDKEIPIYEGVERSRLYAGDFWWNGDRLEYIGGNFDTRFGIDVSAYQNRASENGVINWESVRNAGVEFAMVRIGYRGTSTGAIHADDYYAQNIDGAMAAGIETGVYFFAQAITVEEAIEEAEFVIGLLDNHQISGPVAYDWEMHDYTYRVYGTPPEMATACAIAFCERIAEAGYTPMIYAGQYVSYIKYDQGAMAPYLYWYPEYKSGKSDKLYPTFAYQMDYWQFSSSCYVDGIGGRVDANIHFIPR